MASLVPGAGRSLALLLYFRFARCLIEIGDRRATKETVSLADEMLELLRDFDPTLNLKHNKFYIGIEKDGRTNNFVIFKPKKNHLNLEVRLPQTDKIDAKIGEAGLDTLEYDRRHGAYRLRLGKDDIVSKSEVLNELSRLAYGVRVSS